METGLTQTEDMGPELEMINYSAAYSSEQPDLPHASGATMKPCL